MNKKLKEPLKAFLARKFKWDFFFENDQMKIFPWFLFEVKTRCDPHLSMYRGHEIQEIVHEEEEVLKAKRWVKISLFIMGDDNQNHVRSHAEIKPNN